jgi:muramoyltetrapeptide carboxypeptidase
MLISLENRIKTKCSENMIKTLMGDVSHIDIPHDIETTGNLYGGSLSAFQTLIGTPYAPDMNDAILMLEDVNEHLSRYDRMIGHMRQAGWLKNLSAVMLGDFINSLDNENRPFGFSIEEIIQNNAPNIPLITNAPFGHGDRLCTLPIGAKCTLKNRVLSFKPLSL